jgi:putative ABC transport system ATP-binding protein
MNILEIKKLSKIYQKGKIFTNALSDITLEISEKDFTALVGPSGSGKTTLLHLVGGLDSPSKGEIFFEGKSLSNLTNIELSEIRKNKIGYIFQSYNLIPVLSASENVEFPLILQGVEKQERLQRVKDILSLVDLFDKQNHRPAELSGGQQQRVAVARALVSNPKIILADEPTANLDSKTGEQLLEIMENMNETLGATFLFSTHDPLIMKRAKKRITLKDGQIEKYETL